MPGLLDIGWRSDDALLPWQGCAQHDYANGNDIGQLLGLRSDSEFLTEVPGYHTSQLVCVQNPYTKFWKDRNNNALSPSIGHVRILWALLATINDIPVTIENVEAKTGGLARHLKYKRQLGHSVIHLKVPQKQWRMSAKRLIAAIRRRAHGVRGHWRADHWRPGNRIWIRDHVRGDASFAFERSWRG